MSRCSFVSPLSLLSRVPRLYPRTHIVTSARTLVRDGDVDGIQCDILLNREQIDQIYVAATSKNDVLPFMSDLKTS